MKYLALTIGSDKIQGPREIEELQKNAAGFGGNVFQTAIALLLITVVVLSLIFLVWAGLQWAMSGGEKEKLQKARARVTYSIVGLVLAFSSFFVIGLIDSIFGINLLGN